MKPSLNRQRQHLRSALPAALRASSLAFGLHMTLMSCLAPCAAAQEALVRNTPMQVPESVINALHAPVLEKEGVSGARLKHALDTDSDVLRNWLRSEGYLDAVVIADANDGEAPFFTVDAGALWHVASVDVSPTPPLFAMLPQPGEVFRSEDYEQAKAALRGLWADQGFLRADFTEARVEPDHEHQTVTIYWRVEPGPLFEIGELRIEGAQQYDVKLVERLSLLKAGDVPSRIAIQDGIRNIGLDARYKSAVILPLLDEAIGNRVPLRIEVKEAARRVLTGELGYSSDTGLNIGSTWTDRGVRKGTFEYGLHGLWSRDKSGAGIMASRPTWPGLRDHVGVDLDFLRESTAGRDFDTISGGPFWRRDFARFDFVTISIRQNWISGSTDILRLIEPSISLHMDRRVSNGLPYRGWRADAKLALPWQTNGNGSWLMTRLNGYVYYRWGSWVLLAQRAGFGRTVSLQGDVPKVFRQYLGGSASVRGYALDSLGPVGTDGLAAGGQYAGYTGIDAVLMPEQKYSPVLFADIGKIWNAPTDRETPAISVGAGLVVGTPAGPVRVDIAIPLQRRAQDASFQFYVSLGDVI